MAPISVGFARLAGSLIELQVRYGGRRGPWLLDSAAGWHVLNRTQHPIEIGEALETYAVDVEGVAIAAETLEGELLELGRFAQTPAQVLAVALPYLASTGKPIQGLLGYPLFHDVALTIDWEHQILTLDGPPPVDVIAELPLRIVDRQATIALTLGGVPLTARLETGMTMGLVIEQPEFECERFGTPEEEGRSTVRFEASGLLCGSQALPIWPALFAPDPESPCEARLGLGILSRYTCYIDYRGERLLLAHRITKV